MPKMHSAKRVLSTIGWKNKLFEEEIRSINKIGSTEPIDYLVKILTSKVYDVAIETPLSYAANLSNLLSAYNKISHLNLEQRQRGVVTCSAGNHAQGVAMSAARLGIKATIVMPEATPKIKVNAVSRFGGDMTTIVLHGKNYDEAASEAHRLVQLKGLTLVHPFDDPLVIAGQGTIGMEILKGLKGQDVDIIFVCVGGGGLLAGVASYVKAIKPNVKVIGVEAEDAAGMTESLIADKVVTLAQVGLFADGAAVRTVGKETFRICRELVDEMITVKTDEICAAIKLGFNDTRCVLEPAGALGIAGMVKYVQKYGVQGKSMIAISSGANMDFDRLRFVSERADSSETLMSVTIPEKPGAFRQLHSFLHPRNITEFNYRHNGTTTANIIVSFQALAGRQVDEDKAAIAVVLESHGYKVQDLSNNEMAKAHTRHMSGGRAPKSFAQGFEATSDEANKGCETLYEVVYRFEFPEAPGALNKFLDTLNHFNQGWSISLFHYRNRGHDYGLVLVGLLVKGNEKAAFHKFLEQLEYTYYDETNNASYKLFMQ